MENRKRILVIEVYAEDFKQDDGSSYQNKIVPSISVNPNNYIESEKREPTKINKTVDISKLKAWAAKNLPISSNVRNLILSEKNELSSEEFLAKMEDWLKLFDVESLQSNLRS